MHIVKIIIYQFIILCISVIYSPLFSEETYGGSFTVDSRITSAELNRYLQYTRDRSGTATYEEILSSTGNFVEHQTDSPLILRYTSDAIWIKLDVANKENQLFNWILEFRYPLIDDLEVYQMTDSGMQVMYGGDRLPGKDRVIRSRTFAFPISSPPGASYVMLRIKSHGSVNINLHAWSNSNFQDFLRDDQLFQGIFFGIMAALFIYNLCIFIFSGNRSYIFLVLYIASVTIYSAINNGFSTVYFWPASDYFAPLSHPVFLFASIVSITLFTCSFLSLDQHYPRLNRYIVSYASAILLFTSLPFIIPYSLVTQISVITTLFTALLLTVIALISFKTSRREALYYITSYIFFAVGSILLAIRAYGVTSETYYEVWGMQTGAALMVILLSLGVADKIRVYRNEKEKALLEKQETEKKFQILFENAHDGIIIQQNHRFIYANSAFRKLTGYSTKDLEKINPDLILHRGTAEISNDESSSYQYNGNIQTSSGEKIDVIISVAEAEISGESAQMIIITDVTSLKKAEETIRQQYSEIESQYEEMAALNEELSSNHIEIVEAHEKLGREKEQLSATIKSITEAVISIDNRCIITLVNPEAERLAAMPYSELIGREFSSVFRFRYYKNRAPYKDPASTLIEEHAAITSETPVFFINSTGDELILELTGNPVITEKRNISGGVIILHDITEKFKLEQEILRIQKIDSLSVLAGGIAHDFNNLLTAILGNISLAKYSRLEGDDYLSFLNQIEQAAAKATGLTQQLLTFSKGGDPVKRPESIRQLLQSDVEFMLTGSKIKGVIEISENLLNAEVDINQFNQVIQNLIINAMQAMPDGGTLRIKAENVLSVKSLPLRPGRYIKISIIDEGVGIPEENLDKIFDPYFTTKKTGSGLGLASCYSIIKRHGGYIEVKSSPGKGSCFNIFLPATDKKSESHSSIVTFHDFSGKTVLLMDDDPAIREVTVKMLKSLKLDVTACSHGDEAIELYQGRLNNKTPYDVFITDLVIPGGMSGDAVFSKIKEIDPGVKGIAISGYATDPVLSNYREYGFAGCLSKPFDLRSLSNILTQVLGG